VLVKENATNCLQNPLGAENVGPRPCSASLAGCWWARSR
jgi:hypothetical protein